MNDLIVKFDQATQSLDALNAAAYRMLGDAVCQIRAYDAQFVVSLTAKDARADHALVRERFLNLVVDENLRLQIAQRTEPVRNLILALAFGAMANPSPESN